VIKANIVVICGPFEIFSALFGLNSLFVCLFVLFI